MSKPIGRRQFLKGSAVGVASAIAAPMIVPSTALGQAGKPPPSDKVVIGCIGVGDLGRRHHLAGVLMQDPKIKDRVEVVAVCDVDRDHRDMAARIVKDVTGRRVGIYEDFRDLLDRKDIDAVMVVVPDHWHAICSIAAMEAGKDVYCEKPLTLTIEESKAMVKAARRYGTVFQTGSQQRSDARFRQACELAVNGKIGKIHKVTTHIGGIGSGKWMAPATPPPELNWDFWLGQTPYVDYVPNQVHYEFRWSEAYSGGKMTDWGAHHNDIAQWGLGMDGSGPVKIEPTEYTFAEKGPFTVPTSFKVTYTYADGTILECNSGGENGVKFYGENDQWIFVNRGKIEASNPDILKIELGPNDKHLYKSDHHHENWLNCIQTRERPICDVEIGHRSVTVCHLGNIAMRLGRTLKWDPKAEHFVNDPEADRFMSRPRRSPWAL